MAQQEGPLWHAGGYGTSMAVVGSQRPPFCASTAKKVRVDVKPLLQALLLADRVYTDVTGKHIIAGTFNKLVFVPGVLEAKTIDVGGEEKRVIPGGMQAGSPYVYISLTELRGQTRFVLRYVNLEQDKPHFETQFSVDVSDPLKTVELVFPMPSLPHVAGVHALELLCDDEPLGSYRVIVEEMKEHDNGTDSSD